MKTIIKNGQKFIVTDALYEKAAKIDGRKIKANNKVTSRQQHLQLGGNDVINEYINEIYNTFIDISKYEEKVKNSELFSNAEFLNIFNKPSYKRFVSKWDKYVAILRSTNKEYAKDKETLIQNFKEYGGPRNLINKEFDNIGGKTLLAYMIKRLGIEKSKETKQKKENERKEEEKQKSKKSERSIENDISSYITKILNDKLDDISEALKAKEEDFKDLMQNNLPSDYPKDIKIKFTEKLMRQFNNAETKLDIVGYILDEIKTDISSEYESMFEKDANDFIKRASNLNINKSEQNFLDSFIQKCIFKYMSYYLTGNGAKEKIEATSQLTPEIPKDLIKLLFKYIEDVIKKILIHQESSKELKSYKKEDNKNPTSSGIETTDDVKKYWKDFSTQVLNENPISPIDDIFCGIYKIIIKKIDSTLREGYENYKTILTEEEVALAHREETPVVQPFVMDQSYFGGGGQGGGPGSDNLATKETDVSKTALLAAQSSDEGDGSGDDKGGKKDDDSMITKLKKYVINSYDMYRKQLYDYTIKILDNIDFNDKICENIIIYFNDKKFNSNYPHGIKNKEEADKILSDIIKIISPNTSTIKDTNISEGIISKLKNKILKSDDKDKNESEKEIKDNFDNAINHLSQMLKIYIHYTGEYYDAIVGTYKELITNNTNSNNTTSNNYIKNYTKIIDKMNEYISKKEYKSVYAGYSIINELYLKLEEYGEKSLKIESNSLSSIFGSDNIEAFHDLMGRYPSQEDYKLYRDTYQALINAKGKFDDILKGYKSYLESNFYYEFGKYLYGDYFLKKETELQYKIFNIMIGDESISKESIDFLKRCIAYMYLGKIAEEELPEDKEAKKSKKVKESYQYKLNEDILDTRELVKNGPYDFDKSTSESDDKESDEDSDNKKKKKDKKIEYKDTKSIKIARDIVGNTRINEKDIASLFASITSTNPKKVSSQTLITLLMSSDVSRGFKFIRIQVPSRFFYSQPVIMIDKSSGMFAGAITFLSFDGLRSAIESGTSLGKMISNYVKNSKSDSIF